MVKNLAKKAMTTKGQKACYVIDHLTEALGGEPSSSLRRALILTDIHQYPQTTQTAVMERLFIKKSVITREVEWLYNYGCIKLEECTEDARAKTITVCGYSRKATEAALDYFDGDHEAMKEFIRQMVGFLDLEKPTLRDAKIVAALYEKGEAPKSVILNDLYKSSPSTDNRAYNRLVDNGVISDG